MDNWLSVLAPVNNFISDYKISRWLWYAAEDLRSSIPNQAKKASKTGSSVTKLSFSNSKVQQTDSYHPQTVFYEGGRLKHYLWTSSLVLSHLYELMRWIPKVYWHSFSSTQSTQKWSCMCLTTNVYIERGSSAFWRSGCFIWMITKAVRYTNPPSESKLVFTSRNLHLEHIV